MIDNAEVVRRVAEAAGVGRGDARRAMSAWWAVAWRLMFSTRLTPHDGSAKASVMLPGVGRLWSAGRDKFATANVERRRAKRMRNKDQAYDGDKESEAAVRQRDDDSGGVRG